MSPGERQAVDSLLQLVLLHIEAVTRISHGLVEFLTELRDAADSLAE